MARAVLCGATVGYRNHPQLERFRACADPVAAVDTYLYGVWAEAQRRGYRFDASKLGGGDQALRLAVTDGQLTCEAAHLRAKLERRAPDRCGALDGATCVEAHPLFRVVAGEIENWEKKR